MPKRKQEVSNVISLLKWLIFVILCVLCFHRQSFFFTFIYSIVASVVCSLANYSVAYEETQWNRVSDFRDFVCSLFPKAIFFYFFISRTGCVSWLSHFLGIFTYVFTGISSQLKLQPFSIAITSLGEERELVFVLFVRLFDLRLFGFVCFIFLLVSGKGCSVWLWHSLDFSLIPFFISSFKSP